MSFNNENEEIMTHDKLRIVVFGQDAISNNYTVNAQGAVTLLKEEMEFGRPVTDDQIEEERRKIIDMVKVMETEGKISFRQKGKSNASNSMGSSHTGLGCSTIEQR